MTVGQVVISKRGRDKGRAMIVINANNLDILDKEGEYVYLVDGVVRTLSKPKKKEGQACAAHQYRSRFRMLWFTRSARRGYPKIIEITGKGVSRIVKGRCYRG
jgi:hypothetical protein